MAQDTSPYAVIAPNALVLIFNYTDRMVSPPGTVNAQQVERQIMTTASLRSIKTQKSKSSASGQFEIELAPNYNWLSILTAGSWVAILMTRDIALDSKTDSVAASPKTLKMIGRIESIRTAVNVNQATGARETRFLATGRDWGSIFDSTVYVDTLFGTMLGTNPSAIAQLTNKFKTILVDTKDGSTPFYSTSQIVQDILSFYGKSVVQASINPLEGMKTIQIMPDQVFHVPKELAKYCNWRKNAATSVSMGDLVKLVSGRLTGDDKYKDVPESVGWLNPFTVLGQHTYWQILTEHSNPVLNEVVSEIRWEGSTPGLTLYKRIRPFTIAASNLSGLIDQHAKNLPPGASVKKNEALSIINKIYSPYAFLRKTKIPLTDIISVDGGTNWRDKINFVEVLFADATFKKQTDGFNSAIKPDAQIFDKKAAQREGLKPLVLTSKYFPPFDLNPKGQIVKISPLDIAHWKYLLADWYFNTHNMLNGAMTIIGQNQYIGVGENVLFPAKALMPNFNMLLGEFGSTPIEYIYVLAHVENVSHTFTVGEDGARSFVTAIQFVRGIFTNKDGRPISADPTITDRRALHAPKLKKRSTSITTSTEMDPDKKSPFKGN